MKTFLLVLRDKFSVKLIRRILNKQFCRNRRRSAPVSLPPIFGSTYCLLTGGYQRDSRKAVPVKHSSVQFVN